MNKAIRPSNRVRVGNDQTGRVVTTGKRRQGGAWVRTYKVWFPDRNAVRTVRGELIRPAM